ncbi:MAG: tetratricopeptide repeat protein [Xanthomonadales bacterium]|jgi:TolB-like protein/Flp pilus assembly protein TadD|nr:tetratricopeptide repeat protein [Xanthomonadales bacterium]MDH4000496.1 tetratricopeptide repeat protein [Xanthomonadales bacterium]
MTERHSFISATLAELNRRKVLRTVGAYAVGVFVLLQLMDAAVEPLRLPDWLPTLLVVLLILGFPVVFLLAWHLDIRSDGIHRTQSAGLLTRSQSTILFSIMLVAMGGLAYGFYQYYAGVFQSTSLQAPVQVAAEREFTAPENSIAVLPFTDMSQESDQGQFAAGMSEEILNLLAQVDGLNVAARTSSFAFRDNEGDIREIGRLLNVRTVLEGSIRKSGDRIRLTAQLINVEDGFHIWSKIYDRDMTDIFEIQDEVASSIATALVDSFEGLTAKPESRTDSIAAAQAYRTGRLHWWRRTPDELQKAIELFAKALEHDAQYAPAYAAMADTWLLISLYGNITTIKATQKAQAMIEKALAIDPNSAEAFAALGLARWQIGQYDAAESALRQAVELNEDYIPAQLWLAGVLGEQGRYPEEHLVLQQAMQRDPLNELLMVNYAQNLSTRGDWQAGRDILGGLLQLRPDSTILLRFMAKMEIYNGNLVEGWKLANRAYQLAPDNPEDIASLARTWVLLGDVEEAERLVLEGLESAGNNQNLLGTYWMTLMVARRYEEAETLVREWIAEAGDDLPETMKRRFDFQLGMIAIIRGDLPRARDLLISAINDDEVLAYSGDAVMVVTLAALASEQLGDTETAEEMLSDAERKIRRARLNGVDDPGIYYNEAILLTMQSQPERAMQKLNEAYQRGFREQWVMDIDGRLAPLRSHPEFLALMEQIRNEVDQARTEIETLSQVLAQL